MVTGVTSPENCQKLCQERQGCNFFTWVNPQSGFYPNSCWLKGSQGTPQYSASSVSGPRYCSGEVTTTPPQVGCCQTVFISSSGLTPQFQWTRLGTYQYIGPSPDGRPTYQQINVDSPNYLYYLDWLGDWYVNDNLLENMGGLINWDDAWCPSDISENWSFYRWDDVNDWEEDPTLKVKCEDYNPPATTSTTTTTTPRPTTTRTTTTPAGNRCTWGSACNNCAVYTEYEGIRYCCADYCYQGDVFVWEENGHIYCNCYH